MSIPLHLMYYISIGILSFKNFISSLLFCSRLTHFLWAEVFTPYSILGFWPRFHPRNKCFTKKWWWIVDIQEFWSCRHPMIARTSLLKCKNDASFVCEKGRYSVRKIKRVCYLQIRQSFLLRISPSVKGSFNIYGIRGTGGLGGGCEKFCTCP